MEWAAQGRGHGTSARVQAVSGHRSETLDLDFGWFCVKTRAGLDPHRSFLTRDILR